MENSDTGNAIPAPGLIFVGPSCQDFCRFASLHHIWSLLPWENMEMFCPNNGRKPHCMGFGGSLGFVVSHEEVTEKKERHRVRAGIDFSLWDGISGVVSSV